MDSSRTFASMILFCVKIYLNSGINNNVLSYLVSNTISLHDVGDLFVL